MEPRENVDMNPGGVIKVDESNDQNGNVNQVLVTTNTMSFDTNTTQVASSANLICMSDTDQTLTLAERFKCSLCDYSSQTHGHP